MLVEGVGFYVGGNKICLHLVCKLYNIFSYLQFRRHVSDKLFCLHLNFVHQFYTQVKASIIQLSMKNILFSIIYLSA